MINYYRIVWLDREHDFHMETFHTFSDLHFRWNELIETVDYVEVFDNSGRRLASKVQGSIQYEASKRVA
jgi:hypothetical protein